MADLSSTTIYGDLTVTGDIKSQAVAFTATSSSDITSGDPATFGYNITNIGDAWDKDTGEFTAPTHGLYRFTWNGFANSDTEGDVARASPKLNGNYLDGGDGSSTGQARSESDGAYDSAGFNILLELNEGDIITVRVHGTSWYGNGYTTFTGNLEQTL